MVGRRAWVIGGALWAGAACGGSEEEPRFDAFVVLDTYVGYEALPSVVGEKVSAVDAAVRSAAGAAALEEAVEPVEAFAIVPGDCVIGDCPDVFLRFTDGQLMVVRDAFDESGAEVGPPREGERADGLFVLLPIPIAGTALPAYLQQQQRALTVAIEQPDAEAITLGFRNEFAASGASLTATRFAAVGCDEAGCDQTYIELSRLNFGASAPAPIGLLRVGRDGAS
ncbi:MAG: hypothetical protein AAGA56_29875, partial [Myxococcota bacterium]